MYFYPRIRDLREDNDLSQEQIANIIGTSQTQYSRWERGYREIPMHIAVQLAQYYKVSMDYIVERMEVI